MKIIVANWEPFLPRNLMGVRIPPPLLYPPLSFLDFQFFIYSANNFEIVKSKFLGRIFCRSVDNLPY